MIATDTVTVAGEDGSVRLDRWFKRHYPALGHGRLEKLLRTGRIRVDGKRAHASDRVAPGQAIRVPPLDEMAGPAPPGQRQVSPGDEAMLRDAVAIQDKLNYGEPPDWFYPVRENLGGALLMSGDATGAEKVFREDLDHNPRNPRSLFGLQQSLLQQKRDYDAGFVQKEFDASWKGGTQPLKLDDLV